EELSERRVLHGAAPVLHDDDAPPEASDVRQGLGQDGRFLLRTQPGGVHDVLMFSSMYAGVRSLVRIVPSPSPIPRSALTSTRRPCRWTRTASASWATETPLAQTTTPP